LACDRELNQMIIALVRQIRAPCVIDLHPSASAEEAVEHFFPLGEVENAAYKKIAATEHVLIFRQQRRPKQRLILA